VGSRNGFEDSAIYYQHAYDGPVLEFDRASSSDMDDPVGDDRKSSKTTNANDAFFGEYRLAA
jgi:hypothetical protein